MCAEEIKAEARVCRYCGARFEVARRGYCSACHGVIEVDADGICSACGGQAIDVRLDSRFLAPGGSTAPAGVDEPAAGATSALAASVVTPTPAAGVMPPVAVATPMDAAPPAPPSEAVRWSAIGRRPYALLSTGPLWAAGLMFAGWVIEWGRTSGGFLSMVYRGPYLLPVPAIIAALLGVMAVQNRRPGGARRLSKREFTKKWSDNRRKRHIAGARRPGKLRVVLEILCAVMWGLTVYYAVWAERRITGDLGATAGYGGKVAIACAALGFACAVFGLDVRETQMVLVDSDGTIYD
jgi:hypothetical protein